LFMQLNHLQPVFDLSFVLTFSFSLVQSLPRIIDTPISNFALRFSLSV
jgi:hypothetical protein